MSGESIYLDYAATTPVDPRVAALMHEVLLKGLGNSSAAHASGRQASALIEAAREQAAALVGAPAGQLVFTSGASESNNLAIMGTMEAALEIARDAHVISLATEHKSVLEPVRELARRGVATTLLKPDSNGLVDAAELERAIRPQTRLVSLLHVNNETGVAQDLALLAAVCQKHGVPLHIDAAQSAGKLPLSIEGISLLSFTAHKLGGPQGVGALFVAPRHRGHLRAQIFGGTHERGLRAGTLATHQIAGFGLACQLAAQSRAAESIRVATLRDQLWRGIAALPEVQLNGHPTQRAPGILNVSFPGVEGEALFMALPGLMLSTGSACNSRSGEPSFVLRALGRDSQMAQSSLRFSIGRDTTPQQIESAIDQVSRAYLILRATSPANPAPLDDWNDPEGTTHVGEAGEARLGTWIRLVARVRDGVVEDSRVQVYGCQHTQAAAQQLAQRLRGRPLSLLEAGTPEEWRVAVAAPVEKLGRLLIIEDALRALSKT
ncbi:MAG: cysteine desulfurase family protein [Pseudomonadota bacterium]